MSYCETLMSHMDRTKEAILDAAMRVFASAGAGASMADVAAEAGVGRATLYRHASSRDELVASLQHRAVERMASAMEAADLASGEPVEALERLIRAVLSASAEFEFLRSEALHLDAAEVEARINPGFESIVARCRAAGVLNERTPSTWQVRALGMLCHGATYHPSADEPARLVLQTFLHGLGTPPAPGH